LKINCPFCQSCYYEVCVLINCNAALSVATDNRTADGSRLKKLNC